MVHPMSAMGAKSCTPMLKDFTITMASIPELLIKSLSGYLIAWLSHFLPHQSISNLGRRQVNMYCSIPWHL
jgi:hypothetical protein